jgi:hypothetical protein
VEPQAQAAHADDGAAHSSVIDNAADKTDGTVLDDRVACCWFR